MKVIYVGELTESNRVIRDVCDELGVALEFSTELNVLDSDSIILDLSYVKKNMPVDDSLKFLNENYNGRVIIYAPNTDYTDEALKLCYTNGFTNVIRDYLSAGVRKKLTEYLSQERPVKIEQSLPVPKNDNPMNGITKKIGVIGIMPRIGATTQAVQLVKTLSALGKKACYIQENDSAFLDSLELFFSDVKKDNERGRLVYQDIFFYKDKNYAYSQDYDYLIYDYGNCSNMEQLPADFYANDIRIVVCGGNAEEVAALTTLSLQLYQDENIIYIFSFIDPDDRSEVLDLMGDRRERVFFAPFTPDCFRLYEDSAKLYRELLGFREEQISKSKRGFGWKRRR